MKMKNKKNTIIYSLLALFLAGGFAFLITSLFLYSSWLFEANYRYILLLFSTPLVAIALGIILLLFIYFNQKQKTFNKKQMTMIFTIVPLIALLSLFSARFVIKRNYKSVYSFTTEKWLNSPIEQRFHYIDSFEENYNLIGKTYEDVILLLGEPDNEGEGYCEYWLGFGHQLFAIDALYYFIGFDEINIVTEAAVYQS